MNAFLKLTLTVVISSIVALGLAIGYSEHWHARPLAIPEVDRVVLGSGQSFSAFADELAKLGVIEHPRLWSWRARLTGSARRVQAGEYRIREGATPASLLDDLVAGRVIHYEVRLQEGWTVREALAHLARQDTLDHELAGADESTLLGALGLPEGHAEGMFFPDTYAYTRGTSDADILRIAYRKLERTLAEAWAARSSGLPYATPYEALVVASLVEKETGREADRPYIAQVFVSRLNKGMRLQTDPSVIYGIGAAFDGDLRRRDLRHDTPYNTYTRNGLPPTPIALTGASSIEAALHPAPGDYLYFVSRGDGSSQFSESLEEHLAAVEKYQLQ